MTNSLGMRFVLMPPAAELQDSTSPSIETPFYYGVHELTVAQYQQFLAATGYRNASRGASASPGDMVLGDRVQGDRRPATNLTAADADAFCRWLSHYEAASYRLPTQTEWAYACRAGATTRWWFGDDLQRLGRYAWCESNSGGRTHQVGLLEANPFGLHDLLGNVAEWCLVSNHQSVVSNRGAATRCVLCGGNWSSPATDFDKAVNSYDASTTGGLRLVLELPLEARWPRRSAASQRRPSRVN
jgi:formylglycine-generating enzyme required for sulfatase activity